MEQGNYLIDRFDEAARLMPQLLRNELMYMADEDKISAEEFRLRAGRRATVLLPEGEKQIGKTITLSDLSAIVEIATEASVHSAKESLRSGYITASGGHRIGICGTAIVKNGEVDGFRTISSLAVRISKELLGIASELVDSLIIDSNVFSTLIISPPGGGKTTLLRDLIRYISNSGKRVSVADERGEIAALRGGVPQFDIGAHTDVMEFCPRAEAVVFLLRAMNPHVIAMDEITGPEDADALRSALGCGVKLIATAHSGSTGELMKRKLYLDMLTGGLFERIVTISNDNGKRIYQIERCDHNC